MKHFVWIGIILCLRATAFPADNDLVYRVPHMDQVTIRSNLTFKTAGSLELKMDRYLPLKVTNKLAGIIFVVGDASPRTLRDAKDWTFCQSYGRLAAASGYAGITFNHRSSENFSKLPDVRGDIEDLVYFVRTNSADFSVDKDRLCLWFFSGSGPHIAAGTGIHTNYIRSVVAYYPLLVPPASDAEFSSVEQLKRHAPKLPPMLLVKAGQDAPRFNNAIDEFRKTAESLRAPLDYLEHPQGQHAFDIRNDDETSREIIRKTMEFVGRSLKAREN